MSNAVNHRGRGVNVNRIMDKPYNTEFEAHDPVNHPKHYTSHPSGVECIQITRHMRFNPGNAIKYIWRADDKDDPIENYEKAIWYLLDEIERIKNAQQP